MSEHAGLLHGLLADAAAGLLFLLGPMKEPVSGAWPLGCGDAERHRELLEYMLCKAECLCGAMHGCLNCAKHRDLGLPEQTGQNRETRL